MHVYTLRTLHSFSHSYASPREQPYACTLPSHSRLCECYGPGVGSLVGSPRISAASSVPTQGWHDHSHTRCVPVFPGSDPDFAIWHPPLPDGRPSFNKDTPAHLSVHRRKYARSVSSPRSVLPTPVSFGQHRSQRGGVNGEKGRAGLDGHKGVPRERG